MRCSNVHRLKHTLIHSRSSNGKNCLQRDAIKKLAAVYFRIRFEYVFFSCSIQCCGYIWYHERHFFSLHVLFQLGLRCLSFRRLKNCHFGFFFSLFVSIICFGLFFIRILFFPAHDIRSCCMDLVFAEVFVCVCFKKNFLSKQHTSNKKNSCKKYK